MAHWYFPESEFDVFLLKAAKIESSVLLFSMEETWAAKSESEVLKKLISNPTK